MLQAMGKLNLSISQPVGASVHALFASIHVQLLLN